EIGVLRQEAGGRRQKERGRRKEPEEGRSQKKEGARRSIFTNMRCSLAIGIAFLFVSFPA
ncbi:hypothetical protein, partial [Microcoleus sp. B13-B4]|uniref:hypothetical protein n=1 Tax=Microcoleus sp. B13-B4 TaxID=2818651 RepID=UPI002FD4C6E9